MKRAFVLLSASTLALAGCSASAPSQPVQPQEATTQTADADTTAVDCHGGVSLQLPGSGARSPTMGAPRRAQ